MLCETLELGVCGTDREILLSQQPLVPPGEPQLILGHECLARIVAIGSEVTDWRVGDLAVPAVRRALATAHVSPEVAGRPDLLAFGQYVERGIVWLHGFSTRYWLDQPEHLYRVDPELAPWAVLAEPLTCSEKGVNEALAVQRGRLGPACWQDPPPRVLVTGMGPIGFSAVLACICRGWPTTLYGRDRPDSFRAELAQAFGARYLAEEEADFALADVERDGFDLILECTGSDEVLVRVSQSLASRGVLVWLGSSRRPRPLSLNVAQMMRHGVLRNHVHLGAVNAAPRDFHHALEHLDQLRSTHAAALGSLITARVPPEESLWHYEHRQPQGIKTVVEFAPYV